MQHVVALSRAVVILVLDENPSETNLIISQACDSAIIKLKKELEKKVIILCAGRNENSRIAKIS